MFETLSYSTLQHYWWILVAVLASALIFMMFVQGGQVIYNILGKTDKEKDLVLNALGKHYKLTFSIFVTFGGATFASFPAFYATSFGGAYLVWMAILFFMIVQAVAYEYRSKPNNFLGKKTYDVFLFLNGFLVPLLLGVAVATFFTGSNFVVETSNIVNYAGQNTFIASWTTPFYGLEALWNTIQGGFITNISLGITITLLCQIVALLYVINHINDKKLVDRASKMLIPYTVIFLVFFLIFVFKLLTISGFAVDDTMKVFMQDYKYLHNILDNGFIYSLFIGGVVLVLLGIGLGIFKKSRNGFWFAGAGTFSVVLSVLLTAGFNGTAFYPSLADMQSSLTIANASSSYYTLIVMSYVSLMLPFVLAYIIWAWKTIAGEQMKKTDLNKGLEKY